VKFEDILPEIRNRKGRKVRRKAWVGTEDSYLQKTALQGLSYYRNNGDVRYWEEFSSDDLLADDWELMPEPRKHKVTVCLWSDGVARFHGDVFTLNPGDHIVEVKEIEWEMPE
jgi:hypothetical protein